MFVVAACGAFLRMPSASPAPSSPRLARFQISPMSRCLQGRRRLRMRSAPTRSTGSTGAGPAPRSRPRPRLPAWLQLPQHEDHDPARHVFRSSFSRPRPPRARPPWRTPSPMVSPWRPLLVDLLQHERMAFTPFSAPSSSQSSRSACSRQAPSSRARRSLHSQVTEAVSPSSGVAQARLAQNAARSSRGTSRRRADDDEHCGLAPTKTRWSWSTPTEREVASGPRVRPPYDRLGRIAVVIALDQVDDDLGVDSR